MRALRLWGPVVAAMVGIFVVSGLPNPPLPSQVSDKSAHALVYAGLCALVVRALAGGLAARVSARVAGAAMLIAVAYGVSDEIHQSFVPGRVADLADLTADGMGAAAGAAVCWAWGIIRSRSAR